MTNIKTIRIQLCLKKGSIEMSQFEELITIELDRPLTDKERCKITDLLIGILPEEANSINCVSREIVEENCFRTSEGQSSYIDNVGYEEYEAT